MDKKPVVNIIRSRRKTLTLTVSQDSSIVVKAPFFTSDRHIQNFITSHSQWIEKQLEMYRDKKAQPKTYTHGEKFLFLGNELELTIGDYSEIRVDGKKLLYPVGLQFMAQKQMKTWYKKQARTIISEQVHSYAQIMGTNFTGLTFSDTSSQWGSCTHENKLQFNWRLIMAPILVVNYVVVHELSHTFEKNHSRSFWNLVNKYMPSYKRQRVWLKENHNLLIV